MTLQPLRNENLLGRFRFKYKDVFSAPWFYEQMMEYLQDKGWVSTNPPGKNEYEVRYTQKHDAAGKKEIWFYWRAKKEGHSHLLRMYLDIDAHIIGLADQEMMLNGKKEKVQNGEIELFVACWLCHDPDNKYGDHWFWKYLFRFYFERLDNHYYRNMTKLKLEIQEFQDWLKRFFHMRRWIKDDLRGFKPELSWPSHIKKSEQ